MDVLRAEARDYRSRAIAAADQGDVESERVFKITALALHAVAEAAERDLEEDA